MADQSVSDVLAVRSYKGDSTAGGSQTFGIKLDATPFDKLAQFTYFQNKEMWERQNTQDDLAAKEMAKMMALDVNSAFPEFYEHLNAKKDELSKLIQDDATVLNYQKNPEGYKKMQRLYGEIANDRTAATANDLKYNTEITRIKLLPVEEQQAQKDLLEIEKKRLLMDGAAKGLQQKPLLAIGGKFTAKDFELPDAGTVMYQTAFAMGDNNKQIEVTALDFNSAWVQSVKAANQIDQAEFVPKPNPNNDQNINLDNESGKIQFDQNKKSGNANQYTEATVAKFKDIVDQYYTALKESTDKGTTPPPKPEFISSVEAVNENITAAENNLAEQSKRGSKPYIPGARKINLEDGVSKEELIYLNTLSKEKEFIKYKETLNNTGQAYNYAKLATEDDNADKDRAARSAIARLPYDMQKEQIQALGEGHFGNLIFGVNLPKGKVEVPNIESGTASIKDGAVIDDQGNILTQVNGDAELPRGAINNSILLEYNKYAGVKTTDKDGVVTTENNPGQQIAPKGRLRANYENGVIKGIYSQDGTLIDVDMMQQITIKAGQMGVTKYKSPNTEYGVGGDPTKQTTPGTTTTKSSAKGGGSMSDSEYQAWKKSKGL